MDVVGWFALGSLGAVIAAAAVFGRRADRKQAAGARAWAADNGLSVASESALPVDMRRLRSRSLPSFRGAIDDLGIFVVPWRTRPRWGSVWIFSASLPRRPPLFVASRVHFASAHVLGLEKVRGLAEVKTGDSKLDAVYFVQVEDPDDVDRALPEWLRHALVRAAPLLYAYTSRRDGRTLLFAIQGYDLETGELLSRALDAFLELTREPSTYRDAG